MELVVNKTSLIEEITSLTTIDQFVETIFVDNNSGLLEVSQTIKVGDRLHNISKQINYELKSTRLTIKSCKLLEGKVMISDLSRDQTIYKGSSNCELLCKNVNSIFANEFSNFEKLKIENFNLHNQNIFKKLFNPNTSEKLFNRIVELSKGKSWILLPEKYINILEKSTLFQKNNNFVDKFIYCIGKMNDCSVYVNNQESTNIYFGNYESVTIIINKNLDIKDFKSIQEPFQDSKKITIGYEFIQNDELICLKVS